MSTNLRAEDFADNQKKKPRGSLQGTTAERRSEIARLGGLAVSRDREWMRKLGSIGGKKVSSDRRWMAAIGKKGGAAARARTDA